MTVLVELRPPSQDDADEITVVPDLESALEENRCACAAGDDNPY